MNQQLSEDDVIRRLEQYRPSGPSAEWGRTERSVALEAAQHTDDATRTRHTPTDRRHRWVAIAGGLAAAAVAVLIVELVPSGGQRHPGAGGQVASTPVNIATSPAMSNAPVGPVERLADAARNTTLGNPADGQYWHQELATGDTNWVAPNGDDWHVNTDSTCTFYKYVGTPNPNHVNMRYLAGLPTDPGALYAYLQAHVSGSGSIAEAVFVAIGDALHNDEGLVPPNLRAAFVEVLARIPSVVVRSGVAYGQGGTATTFTLRAGQSLWFGEASAQLVYEGGAPVYRIADQLPAEVASRQTCPRGAD